MGGYMSDWLTFLRVSDSLICVPLLLAGAAVMFLGWRVWRACVVLSFVLLGVLCGQSLIPDGELQFAACIGVAAIASVASYKLAKYAAGVLGGLAVGLLIMYVLEDYGVRGWALWMAGAAFVLIGAGYSSINQRIVIVALTGCLGAVILLSGLAVLLMQSRVLYSNVSALTSQSVILPPFFLLVPTVMSALYQLSDMRRQNVQF